MLLNSKNDLSIIVLDRKEKMETGIEKVLNNYEERERVFNYELEMLIIMLIIFNHYANYIQPNYTIFLTD